MFKKYGVIIDCLRHCDLETFVFDRKSVKEKKNTDQGLGVTVVLTSKL